MKSLRRINIGSVGLTLIIAVSSFFGTWLGAYSQSHTTIRSVEITVSAEREKQLLAWKKESYEDFFMFQKRFFKIFVQLITNPNSGENILSALDNDSGVQGIYLFGSQPVITATQELMTLQFSGFLRLVNLRQNLDAHNCNDVKSYFEESIAYITNLAPKITNLEALMMADLGQSTKTIEVYKTTSAKIMQTLPSTLKKAIGQIQCD